MEYISASSVEIESGAVEPESLTVLQAARRAGVTQSAIIRWIRNGYLPATPSSNGWQIPASELERAHAAADESRGTGPVPRQTGPRLVPAPADLRQSLAVQAQEQPGRLDVVGEAIVSPLVELIRDQGDVVHDQAEVIGWLQGERSRLTAQLAELKQQEQLAEREPALAIADESMTPDDNDVDDNHVDEVVSWLWNDTALPFEAQTPSPELAGEPDQEEPSLPAERVVFQTRAADLQGASHNPVPTTEAETTTSQDLANETRDDIWATTAAVDQPAKVAPPSVTFRTSPAPALRPIVPKHGERQNVDAETTLIEAGADAGLREMIDTTEAKIFNLWRTETEREFQYSGHGVDNDDDAVNTGGATFWQRLWPLKRRSS